MIESISVNPFLRRLSLNTTYGLPDKSCFVINNILKISPHFAACSLCISRILLIIDTNCVAVSYGTYTSFSELDLHILLSRIFLIPSNPESNVFGLRKSLFVSSKRIDIICINSIYCSYEVLPFTFCSVSITSFGLAYRIVS